MRISDWCSDVCSSDLKSLANDKAVAAEKPAALHLLDTIDDLHHPDDSAAWHGRFFRIVHIQLGLRHASVNDHPATALSGPVAVLNVLAVVENIMRVWLLDRQRLDLAGFNSCRQFQKVCHAAPGVALAIAAKAVCQIELSIDGSKP